jgi:hypothetical protein
METIGYSRIEVGWITERTFLLGGLGKAGENLPCAVLQLLCRRLRAQLQAGQSSAVCVNTKISFVFIF